MKRLFFILAIGILIFNSCGSMTKAQLAGYRKKDIEQWQKTPEEGVLLDPVAAVVLHVVQEEGLDGNWEDSIDRVTLAKPSMRSVQDSVAKYNGLSVPVRIYDPGDKYYKAGEKPLIMFIHGGGFVTGSINSHDQVARYLAKYSGGIVVSIEYRLAPEFPFPAALDDSNAALEWTIQHASDWGADPGKLVVSGDSAGGNLAAVLSQQDLLRDNPRIKLQVLYYPGMSFTLEKTPSRIFYAGSGQYFFLTEEDFMEARAGYLADRVKDYDPRVSPGLGEIDSSLAPAYIMTAQCCPLRDEGKAYALKLEEHGVENIYREVPGVFHGFLNMDRYFPQSRKVLKETGEFIRTRLP